MRELPSLKQYVQLHLGYELLCLLVAATSWEADRRTDRREVPPYFFTETQSSAFLHARNLYEVFCTPGSWMQNVRLGLGLAGSIPSPTYKKYKTELHVRVHHVMPARPYYEGERTPDDLKDQPVTFARNVLDLWDRVAALASAEFSDPFSEARRDAIAAANQEASWHGVDPLFR